MGEAKRRKELGLGPKGPKRDKISAAERRELSSQVVSEILGGSGTPGVDQIVASVRKNGLKI